MGTIPEEARAIPASDDVDDQFDDEQGSAVGITVGFLAVLGLAIWLWRRRR